MLEVILEGLYEGVEDTEVAELPGHPGRVLDQEDLQEDQLQALDHLHNPVSYTTVQSICCSTTSVIRTLCHCKASSLTVTEHVYQQ